MQTLYANYSATSLRKGKNAANRHMKQKDFLERSEKRSPYDDASMQPKKTEKPNKGPKTSVPFALLTLVLLVFVYPVGLFFLWSRRIRWNGAAKLILTFAAGLAFCMLTIFALHFETRNPRIRRAQDAVRGGLEWVYAQTTSVTGGAADWCGARADAFLQKAEAIWDDLDESAARKGLELYGHVDENISAVRRVLPGVLLSGYKRLVGYAEPEAARAPEPVSEKGVSVTVRGTEPPTGQPTPTPTPTPTPEPTPTPTPVPTAAPVTLPKIKNVADAPVYYTKGGTYYHVTENRSGMMNAVSHKLSEAQADGKKVCEKCGVVSYNLMDTEYYLWVDEKNVAHTTDECAEFFGYRYFVYPFEDVYEGSFSYCAACGGSACFEYMRQNDERFNVAYENLDEGMKELYDFEKTVTVYYGESSRSYHANPECQYMKDAKYVHTLYQALHVDGKQRCEICAAMTEAQAMEKMKK